MGICSDCQHFRRARPLSQILAAAFTTNDSDVSRELKSLQEDERKLRDTEAESLRLQASMGKPHFLSRPRMTDFCALEEEAGVYLIAEIKNAGGQCKKFDPGTRPRKACGDCVHNVKADGRDRDARKEQMVARIKVSAIGARASTNEADSLMSGHRQNVTSRKAFEISSVALNRGELPNRPDYLDHCGRMSTDGNYVVGAYCNPFHDCNKWEAAMPTNVSTQPDQDAAAPQPAVTMPSTPTAMPLQPATAPAPAEPPNPFLAQIIAAIEWLLDVTVPPEGRALIQKGFAEALARNNQNEMNALMKLVQLHESTLAQPSELRIATREVYQPEFVAGLRGQPDAINRLLVALYDAANAPIAAGNPPLTHEMANCYLDLLAFARSIEVYKEWQPLPDANRAQQIQMLAMQYPLMRPELQAWFASLPRGWTGMRAAWVMTPPQGRLQLRQQFLASLGMGQPEPPAAVDPYQLPSWQPQYPLSPMPQGPVAPQPFAPQPFASQPSAPSGGDKTVDDLLRETLEDDKRQEAEAAKESPELALQVRLANNARNAQTLSNIMQMRTDMSMTFAKNSR